MPLINLVQERQQATRRNENQARILFFACVGVSGLSVFGFLTLSLVAVGVNATAARMKADLAKVAPQERIMQANERDFNALQPRLVVLQTATKMTDKWNRILTSLVTETPSGAWLTAIHGNCQDPKKPILVGLVGKGSEQRVIADLMLRTQTMDDLENVSLKFTEKHTDSEADTIDFELDADVKGTAPEKKADKPAAGAKA
jgi:Tfp pilus assembly protein PilN